ncbi:olfactomedin-like protein 3 [Esox lucius]|uniref:Olfactomedin-like domain-containing protein n=1 Tax=Esox lucius TaxID=8010 RepID=A0A3P8YI96_ESOLU|nr:olfactomedin-like protein 3 [Esox lucius]
MYTWLWTLLFLSMNMGLAQRSTQEAFMLQYFERRIAQLEERLIKCEQNTLRLDQKIYDVSTEVRSQLAGVEVHRTEMKSQVDSVALRVERIERDVEYLETKIPNQPHIQVQDDLLEQQIKEAQKKKVKFTLGIDCSTTLTGVKSMKIVKKAENVYGSWLKDPTKGSVKIYVFSGNKNNTLLEFKSLKSVIEGRPAQARQIHLPFPWQGSGHTVFNGFVYYHKADTPNQILKVHLLNRTVADSMLLPGAGRLPVYALTTHTFLDLAVDELGLWVIYADPELGGNLVITKLDQSSLAVEHSWDTSCRSHNAETAFMICGTLYVVYNSRHGGRSSIDCLYDIHDTIHSQESPVMFFPKRYTNHYSIHYHPKDKLLYAWDDGFQTIYKLGVKSKQD